MEYNRENLENKKLNELKDIARNLQLTSSGRKREIVDRILESQHNYFQLLPKDVLNIVEDYKIYNSKNNQFLLLLLDILKWSKSRKESTRELPPELQKYSLLIYSFRHNGNWIDKWIADINKIFVKNNIDVEFIPNIKDKSKFTIKIGKIPLITDDMMADILMAFSQHPFGDENLNLILYEEDMNFGVVKFFMKSDYKYIISYGGKRLIK